MFVNYKYKSLISSVVQSTGLVNQGSGVRFSDEASHVDFKNTSEQKSRKYNIVFNRRPKNRSKNVFPAPTV